eukprot:g11948.t1
MVTTLMNKRRDEQSSTTATTNWKISKMDQSYPLKRIGPDPSLHLVPAAADEQNADNKVTKPSYADEDHDVGSESERDEEDADVDRALKDAAATVGSNDDAATCAVKVAAAKQNADAESDAVSASTPTTVEFQCASGDAEAAANTETDIRTCGEKLFASTSWNTVSYTRWLNVCKAWESICSLGFLRLRTMDGGVEYQLASDDAVVPLRFTPNEQRKLMQVSTCALLACTATNRSQRVTLSVEGKSSTTPDEESLRNLRQRSFGEGHIAAGKRLVFLPADIFYSGGGKLSFDSAQEHRFAAAGSALTNMGAMMGRVTESQTCWGRFIGDYKKLESEPARQEMLDLLAANFLQTGDDGRARIQAPSIQGSKRNLDRHRRDNIFLRYISCRDYKASVTLFACVGEQMAAAKPADRIPLMESHLLYLGRTKDASVMMERLMKFPKTEAQYFKCGIARNCESNSASAQSRHFRLSFAGATERISRFVAEKERQLRRVCSEPRRCGGLYEFRHETNSRNELLDIWDGKTDAEKAEYARACYKRHWHKYNEKSAVALAKLRRLRQEGIGEDDLIQVDRRKKLQRRFRELKEQLHLPRGVVTEYSRYLTNPFSKFSFPPNFKHPATVAMLEFDYWTPKASLLAQTLGVLRENRRAARRKLKLRLPEGPDRNKYTDDPLKFDQIEKSSAESKILGAALRAAKEYDAGKIDEEVDKNLRLHYERLLKAAITRSEAIAKNTKVCEKARMCQALEPHRQKDRVLIVEMRKPGMETPDVCGLVAFPVARNDNDVEQGQQFQFFDATADFQKELEEDEKVLRDFYPTLDHLELSPSSIFRPRIVNDPHLLLEKQQEVWPVAGRPRAPKPEPMPDDAATEADEDNGKQEQKKATLHAKNQHELFVERRPQRRDAQIAKQYHFLHGLIHGVEEVPGDLIAYSDELAQKELDEELGYNLGLTHYRDDMTVGELENLATSVGLGGAAPESLSQTEAELDPREEDSDEEKGGGHSGEAGAAHSKAPVGGAAAGAQNEHPRADVADGRDDSDPSLARINAAGDALLDAVLSNSLEDLDRRRLEGSSGGSGAQDQEQEEEDNPSFVSRLTREQREDQESKSGLEEDSGTIRMTQHPFWPLQDFKWRSRSAVEELFLNHGEVSRCLQCYPLADTPEGHRYYAIVKKLPVLAPALLHAQPSTKSATRNFKKGRLQVARRFLQAWAQRARFILKHFVDRRDKPPEENEQKLLQQLFKKWMHVAEKSYREITDATAAERKAFEKLLQPLHPGMLLFLRWTPTFELTNWPTAKRIMSEREQGQTQTKQEQGQRQTKSIKVQNKGSAGLARPRPSPK